MSLEFDQVPRARWKDFFEGVTRVMAGKLAEVEVVGLDLGDQIQAEHLRLNGIAYEPRSDVLYVYMDETDRHLDHAVPHPREIFIQMGHEGLTQVVIVDQEDHKQFVRLRAPLALPPAA